MCVCVCAIEYYSAIKKKKNLAICDSVDGLGVRYAKWNKSDRERQIQFNLCYFWNLKKQQQANLKKQRHTKNTHTKVKLIGTENSG